MPDARWTAAAGALIEKVKALAQVTVVTHIHGAQCCRVSGRSRRRQRPVRRRRRRGDWRIVGRSARPRGAAVGAARHLCAGGPRRPAHGRWVHARAAQLVAAALSAAREDRRGRGRDSAAPRPVCSRLGPRGGAARGPRALVGRRAGERPPPVGGRRRSASLAKVVRNARRRRAADRDGNRRRRRPAGDPPGGRRSRSSRTKRVAWSSACRARPSSSAPPSTCCLPRASSASLKALHAERVRSLTR